MVVHAFGYLGSILIKLCHSVPCCNNQLGWSEAASGWEQLSQLITSSLEKGGVECHPVVNVPKPSDTCSNIHIIPERSNQ